MLFATMVDMGLNIKNDRVHALARQAAEITGMSQTGVIEEALRRLLEQYGADPQQAERQRRLDRATGIATAYRADPGDRHRAVTRVEDLYDERSGLPQ